MTTGTVELNNNRNNDNGNDAPLPILDSQTVESIVFRRDNTKGIFHKRIVSRNIIINRRIIHTTNASDYAFRSG